MALVRPSAHNGTNPAPSRLREKEDHLGEKISKFFCEGTLGGIALWFIVRPEYEKGFALHILDRNGLPIATIVAVRPVVSHHKVAAYRDCIWAVIGHAMPRMNGAAKTRILLMGIEKCFIQLLAIDEDSPVSDADHLIRQRDHTFDVEDREVARIFEDHDVAALDF